MSDILEISNNYYTDVRNLKSYFIHNCRAQKKYEGYKIWSHWLIRNLCCYDNDEHTERKDRRIYHLIPTNNVSNDSYIINHLISKGSSIEHAKNFYSQICCMVSKLISSYHHFKLKHNDCNYLQTMNDNIVITYNKFTKLYNLVFKDTYVKIPEHKYKILLSQYTGNPRYLNYYLFEVCYNYYILDGNGMQWAVPIKLGEYLEQELKATTELCASPFNHHLPLYCSLFYVDMQFGAMDNIFELNPKQQLSGVFEINPPFIEHVFEQTTNLILSLLQYSNQPLMFIYIMPSWTDSPSYLRLHNNSHKFLLDEITLNPNTHYYYQYCDQQIITANFKTKVLILGNQDSLWSPIIRDNIISKFT